MLTTKQKVLRRFWYPVVPAASLDEGPQKFVLLGENLVLWRDATGKPACLENRCCHRTAELSRGFVEEGNIVCGYHGWTFDATGRCVRIPQRLDGAVSDRIAIAGYRTEERYGFIWVALDEPLAALPELPEADEPGFRYIPQFYEEWNIGALRLMENSFDNAHVAFTHRASFGDVADPLPSKNEITEVDYGFHVHTEIPVRVRGIGSAVTGSAGDSTMRKIHSTWFLPFARRLGITYPNGLRHTIFTAATPIADDRAMVVQFCYRNDTEADVPAADVNAFDRQVTLEDKIILETTDCDVSLDPQGAGEYHMVSDRPGLLMRKKLRAVLAENGEPEMRRDGPVPVRLAAAE